VTGTDVVEMASGVGATDTLVTRVVRVEGDTVPEFTMADDQTELGIDGATVEAFDAFRSKMSVWAPSAHPHF
jgi:hypothetical protein